MYDIAHSGSPMAVNRRRWTYGRWLTHPILARNPLHWWIFSTDRDFFKKSMSSRGLPASGAENTK